MIDSNNKFKSNSERDIRLTIENDPNKIRNAAASTRRALSGEEIITPSLIHQQHHYHHSSYLHASSSTCSSSTYEPKTKGERRHIVPQHLSLPGSDMARRLTILSPHSPQPELFHSSSVV